MKNASFTGVWAATAALLLATGCPAGDDSNADSTNTMPVTMSGTSPTGTDTSDTESDPSMTNTSNDSEDESSSGGTVECPDDSLSFAADIQPIFDANCVDGCHEPGGNWSTMDLSVDAYAIIVDEDSLETMTVDGLLVIAPNDVPNSYLVHKLRGTQGDVVDPALAQQSMPSVEVECTPGDEGCPMTGIMIVEDDPLPDATIQTIEDWINCGAPE
jgi:hypothetical protein